MKIQFVKTKSRIKFYLAGLFSIANRAIPILNKDRNNGKTRIIVFHHIDNRKRFYNIIKKISRKYNVISFSDYIEGRYDNERMNVIVALDDGYESWYSNAYLVFQAFGVCPLLFISSGFINLQPEAASTFCKDNIFTWPEPSLQWWQLEKFQKIGAEIGGHTCNHIDISSSDYDRNFVFSEINDDRLRIRENLGEMPKCFAYPFGRYNAAIVEEVEKAGYKYCFSSQSGFIDKGQSLFLINRTNVGMRPAWIVCAVIDGWHDMIEKSVSSIKNAILGR